jgi:hypothetical protein
MGGLEPFFLMQGFVIRRLAYIIVPSPKQRGDGQFAVDGGNSSRPDGTSQRHALQVTTNVLRPEGVKNMPT